MTLSLTVDHIFRSLSYDLCVSTSVFFNWQLQKVVGLVIEPAH
jgi:hypothetical protein